MKKIVILQQTKLPKMLGDLVHSNQFLKFFSVMSFALAFVSTVSLFVFTTKEPLLITLNSEGQILERSEAPHVHDQIQEAIKVYLNKRYQWGPENVVKRLKESESFIMPNTLKAFQGAISNVAKFSVEKIVSQRVYPEKIDIDLKKKTAFITGDRVTTIQGLKAAGDLKLELSFEPGPRTESNPWGLYISKEREE